MKTHARRMVVKVLTFLVAGSCSAAAGQPALAPLPVAAAYAQTPTGRADDPAAKPQSSDAPAESKPASGSAEAPAPSKPGFGEAGWWGLTFTSGYAFDFDNAHSINPLSVAVSTFVAPDFEVMLDAGGWAYVQDGPDTAGGTLTLAGRWHAWHTPDYAWSAYLDAGVGLSVTGDEVPAGGSEFNFNPRAGAGLTMALGESRRAPRLQGGVRWHHMSNGRIFGGDRNEGRDSVMVYFGVTLSL